MQPHIGNANNAKAEIRTRFMVIGFVPRIDIGGMLPLPRRKVQAHFKQSRRVQDSYLDRILTRGSRRKLQAEWMSRSAA